MYVSTLIDIIPGINSPLSTHEKAQYWGDENEVYVWS